MRLDAGTRYGIALLIIGSAMPAIGWSHSEGVEAADPATPPAVLELRSAVLAYAPARAAPVSWRERFGATASTAVDHAAHMPSDADHQGHAGMHAGHTGSDQQAPPTAQQ